MLSAQTMVVGGKYNWKGQEERLVYLGRRRYPGDSRGWFQFAKVDQPEIVWCEVLEADLPSLEETADTEVLLDLPVGRASKAIAEFSDKVISLHRTEVKEKDVTYVRTKPRTGDGSLVFELPKGKAVKKALKKVRQRARG